LPPPDEATGLDASASLIVSVPADAKVFVNDRPTTSTGTERHYMSNGLKAGRTYSYTIRAEVVRDGQTITETKAVKLAAGRRADLAFALAAPAETQTRLVLRVPDDARVFLAGHETSGSGAIREFSTSRLAAGSEWADYSVRVEITRDGQTLVREETVTLKAGESREVTFEFDAPQVAQVGT
jgi:uncharacterized protein (TIGR03000 family)